LKTVIGPRIESSSSSTPSGACSAKNLRCSFENSLRDVRRPQLPSHRCAREFLVQRKIWRVEEHLADLRVERIDLEGRRGGRCSSSGAVSFNSTLTAPATNPRSRSSSSSDSSTSLFVLEDAMTSGWP
jgi:hypothetical protein